MKFAQIACLCATLMVAFAAEPLAASAQGILNQSGDQLLKDFGVDPNQLPAQYGQQSAPGQTQYVPGQTQYVPGQSQFVPGQSQFVPGQSQFVPGPSQFLQSQAGGGGTTSTVLRMLSGAIPKVDVDKAGGVKVRAPFINVNVGNGQHDVQVNSPFVKYRTGQGASVHIPGILDVNQPPGDASAQPYVAPQGVPCAPQQQSLQQFPANGASSYPESVPQGVPGLEPGANAPPMVTDPAAPITRIPQMIPTGTGK